MSLSVHGHPTLDRAFRIDPALPTHTPTQALRLALLPTRRHIAAVLAAQICAAEPPAATESVTSLGLFRKQRSADSEEQPESRSQTSQDHSAGLDASPSRPPGVGQVLHTEEGLALIDELDDEAPLGSLLTFTGGAKGILIWRTGALMSIAVMAASGPGCKEGETVACCHTQTGPSEVGNGQDSFQSAGFSPLQGPGGVLDSRVLLQSAHVEQPGTLPFFNPQLTMNEREKITESLLTGVKAVDALTPLARGQCLLLTGAQGAGKSSLALDAILGQHSSGVVCIYAATAPQQSHTEAAQATLSRHSAAERTTVVTSQPGASLGQRYASCCAAMAVAEAVRAKGGHALLVLDDISPLIGVWDVCLRAMTRLLPAGHGEEQVQYADMLVTANEAERRRFFSSLLQRTGKAHRKDGGGSVTSLVIVPGTPALGHSRPKEADIKGYENLSPEYRAKLLAALQRQQGHGGAGTPGMPVELVEELMSIADGQVVLQRDIDGAVSMDFANSISRMGARAHPPAMQALCPPIRLRLAQAADEGKFGVGQGTGLAMGFLGRLQAALQQSPEQPVPLQEQVAMLVALMSGRLDDVAPSHTQQLLAAFVHRLQQHQPPDTMASISDAAPLSAAVRAELDECLCAVLREQASGLTG